MARIETVSWFLLLCACPLAYVTAAEQTDQRHDEAFAQALSNCAFEATERVGKLEKKRPCSNVAQPNGLTLPSKAQKHLPALVAELSSVWPELSNPAAIAAQVEQESCIHLGHAKCWDSRAELKTEREYGFGFGQITKVWEADGAVRFDVFEELKRLDSKLKGWKWEHRFDAAMQLRSLAIINRNNYRKLQFPVANEVERLAFTFAAYNGGFSSVLKDRALCAQTEGCDPSRWFGHVEKHSFKAKRVHPGYSKSFYEINREYPVNVLFMRLPKYAAFLKGGS